MKKGQELISSILKISLTPVDLEENVERSLSPEKTWTFKKEMKIKFNPLHLRFIYKSHCPEIFSKLTNENLFNK